MTPEFKVFVVEDPPTLRELFDILQAAFCEGVSITASESCLDRLKTEKPDMFLLDIPPACGCSPTGASCSPTCWVW